MKKLYSLIKASMTSDMNLFKINTKNSSKASKIMLPIFISLCFMFGIWTNANVFFEQLAPNHLQFVVLALFAFLISLFTIIEGVYKTSSLIFNCKDDQLLLSLPIKKQTVLFIRLFKFYVFEILFNALFMIPLMVAYIRWADNLSWTFFLTSLIMLLMLPIIPIVISTIIGYITTSLSSHFKYKNLVQTISSMLFVLIIMYISFNMDNIINYLINHASSINELISKIYYPAGVYADLSIKFDVLELIIFILINLVILFITVMVLSKFYFKINSRVKKVITTKESKVGNIVIKEHSIYWSLIKKELNTFFKIPVFIVNAGFGLVLFIIMTIAISIKFDGVVNMLINPEGINLSKDLIMNNLSILVLILIIFTSFMTSITNSVISLEGRNINILKSLPLKVKTILMSKIYSCLIITTPVLLIGDLILFIRFKISLIEALLLLIISILMPLVSHFIGILVNLKYPKLDASNSTEVIKQSFSSFIAVMIGMVLLILNIIIVIVLMQNINSTLILLIMIGAYSIINYLLYLLMIKIGTKEFNDLTI